MRRFVAVFAAVAALLMSVQVFYAGNYGIVDDAGIIGSASSELESAMRELSGYCDVYLYTCETNSSESAAEDFYRRSGSSSVFIITIDMKDRQATVKAGGKVAEKISDSKCGVISDRIYSKLSAGKYGEAATDGFILALDYFKYGKLASVTSLVSAAMVGIAFAFMWCIMAVMSRIRRKGVSVSEMNASYDGGFSYDVGSCLFIRQEKHKRSSSSSSSGSGGGGGGGRSSSGSHRF